MGSCVGHIVILRVEATFSSSYRENVASARRVTYSRTSSPLTPTSPDRPSLYNGYYFLSRQTVHTLTLIYSVNFSTMATATAERPRLPN